MQKIFLNKDGEYLITSTDGNKADINTIYFLQKNGSSTKAEVILKYDVHLKQISFLLDSTLIAYYNVESDSSGLMINNYSTLRDKLSFKDVRERNYKLTVEKEEADLLVLKIENSGAINRLIQPVIMDLKLREKKN
jgi:hypothetical protein